jgi:RNA polymerase sigma factor (sigma-70 family)
MERVVDTSMSIEHQATGDNQAGDEVLTRQITSGDVSAWERFYDQYAAWTFRFAMAHLSGNRADAEDLTSDILITAAKSIKRYNAARGPLDAWMLGVARHRLARFCHDRRLEAPFVPAIQDDLSESETPLPDTLIENTLTNEVVTRALASLPQRQAAALIDKYVSGHSVEEIARKSATTLKAVESLLSRGRAAFRAAFTALSQDGRGGVSHD